MLGRRDLCYLRGPAVTGLVVSALITASDLRLVIVTCDKSGERDRRSGVASCLQSPPGCDRPVTGTRGRGSRYPGNGAVTAADLRQRPAALPPIRRRAP